MKYLDHPKCPPSPKYRSSTDTLRILKGKIKYCTKKNKFISIDDIYAFKKTYCSLGATIVNLIIPKGSEIQGLCLYARTMESKYLKLRANKAFVYSQFAVNVLIDHVSSYKEVKSSYSIRDLDFNYETGKYVTAEMQDEPDEECGSGINFFLTIEEAFWY